MTELSIYVAGIISRAVNKVLDPSAGFTHIRLGRAKLELNQTDLGLLHPRRSIGTGDNRLVQEHTFNECGILNCSADLLDHADISKIDIGRGRGQESRDGRDSYRGQYRRVLRNNLVSTAVCQLDIPCYVARSSVRTLEFKLVVAARSKSDLSVRSIGLDISVRYSTALAAAVRNESAIVAG